jgi:hypothetical protein
MDRKSALSASEIQTAVSDLERAHQRITALLESFPQNPDEARLAREIFNDVDRALAKLRFLFTTLEGLDVNLKDALECEWGECRLP